MAYWLTPRNGFHPAVEALHSTPRWMHRYRGFETCQGSRGIYLVHRSRYSCGRASSITPCNLKKTFQIRNNVRPRFLQRLFMSPDTTFALWWTSIEELGLELMNLSYITFGRRKFPNKLTCVRAYSKMVRYVSSSAYTANRPMIYGFDSRDCQIGILLADWVLPRHAVADF